ncbi:MAG: radical SAM protein [Clostridia bacterium]|nr:radical SAM protein [Clostridia bacterium]
MSTCVLCPRECGVDREAGELGFCGAPDALKIARCAPHMWEEPVISGTKGSGAVFFSGCSLRCVFCQNRDISHGSTGREVGEDELCEMLLRLAESGVHNLNFVTPTHYSDKISAILQKIKPQLKIPVVWNCGGYEKPETLAMLDGLVDIYLPDFKYADPALAEKYSAAPDYPQVASAAVSQMFGQVGPVVIGEDGLMKKGVIVRHLVLPGCRKDSISVLDRLAVLLPPKDIFLSLMSQYTPEFASDCEFANLHRRVTNFEYESVLRHADELGFVGFCQDRNSATEKYTPDFGNFVAP